MIMIENGKYPLTSKRAQQIAALFPSVRVEWLIGWNDFETEDDEIEYHRQQSQRAGITEEEMMKRIARQAGYELSYWELPMDDFYMAVKIISSQIVLAR